MTNSKFVHVTYIRTTPEKLWRGLTEPEFTRQYWANTHQVSDWKVGSDWKIVIPDGRVGDAGKVIEIDRPRRLVLSWRNEFLPELKDEAPTRVTYEIEQQGDMVKLTLIHESDVPDSKLIDTVSNGWPVILASLKSLLETGESLESTRKWPEGY
ncbi:MAG: SRPBCC family protein [Hyphomonadaceae bacterium]|nr:SRPBCC family protein [Hyphomonadaceae bacterium]